MVAMAKSFYTVVFTPDTWQVFLALEKKSIGFRFTLIKRVAKLRPGDVLICYLAKAMTWCAALEVAGTSHENKMHVYSTDHGFPILIDVEPIEPPRKLWRLLNLRELSNEEAKQIFP